MYRVTEYLDRKVVSEVEVTHPALEVAVRWYRNGVEQGVTTVGPKGFLLTEDRRYCLVIEPTGENRA